MPLIIQHLTGSQAGLCQTFEDSVDSITIGRDPDRCQVVLDADARMAGREHCTLARIRDRYLIDMNPDRIVRLKGGGIIEPGSPIPPNCALIIGPNGPELKIAVQRSSKFVTTQEQGLDADLVAKRASGAASKAELEQTTEQAAAGHRTAIVAVVSVVLVLVVVVVSALIFTRDVEQLEQADETQTERIAVVEDRADDAEEDLVALGADLPEHLESARASTYLVVRQSKDGGETAFGTAFVVAPGTLATNAHVAKWFDHLDEGDRLILRSVAESGADPIDVPVLSTSHHPGYDAFATLWKEFVPVRLNASNQADSIRSAGSACDIALLHVDAASELGTPLPLAGADSQADLRAGHVIGSVGYPMEGMAMEGVNVQRPMSQTQVARVTALTTFFNTSEDEANLGPGQRNVLLQHSLPATGGASGSPILNGRGEVVGVLSAVNFTLISGQRIPSGVGVNFAQRATLLEELLRGQAAENLPNRLAGWDAAVKRLYYSGRLLRTQGGMEELVATWRSIANVDLRPDQTLEVDEIYRDYFPLDSLEAGRKAAGRDSAIYSTDLAFDVQGGVWYLLAATGDGSVDINVDEASMAAAGIGEVRVLKIGKGTTGIAFRATSSGTVTGMVTSDGGRHMNVKVLGGGPADGPDAVIASVRAQWRDDLFRQWGFGVRDIGGWLRDGQTGIEAGEEGYVAVEPIVVATEGEYILVAVGDETSLVGLKLWQVVDGERTLLASSAPEQQVAFIVFDTDKDAALEAEVQSVEPGTAYALNFYRGVIRGDTDADDSVDFEDLIGVIMEFGSICPGPSPCNLDVDEDGVVNVGDLLGVLGDYGAEWPARTHRFKAWTWGAVGLELADRLTPFTWAASWTSPESIAAKMLALPPGDRVLFFYANLTNDMAVHPDDRCVGIDDGGEEYLTEFISPWIDNGLAKVQSDMVDFMTRFAEAGGQVDAVILDNEKTMSFSQFMDTNRDNFRAIMEDPRFPELEQEIGFSDLTQIGWGNELSRSWDAVLIPRFDVALDQAVFQPIIEQFPGVVTTNYQNYIILPEDATYGVAGHPLMRPGTGVGSHISSPFYARMSTHAANIRPDGVHPIGGTGFAGFRLMVHWLRSMEIADSRPMMPWICNLTWDTPGDTWPHLLYDSPYWSEMVLHMGVSGVDHFLYWTDQNRFNDLPEHNNPITEQQLLSDLLSELETRIGVGGTPLVLGQHSFGDQVVATGMQIGSRVLWRFTFDLGVDEVLVSFEDGGTQLVHAELNRPGAWFEYDVSRPVVMNSAGIPDIN
ncbi:MAG: hypothetical protein HOL13_06700 [Phycisphaerae bacterium]|jgi:hypothetical protein|nr:hypothetical protein [Phycisphaerae bacterium]MBT5583622.1 hypothetical protein [Phycisphaerae bacterium]MBT5658505.1 hypothetical protein [Phycisphaerae bacterium]